MLTIGKQGKIDDVSINMHIISGLNDTALTKPLATMGFTKTETKYNERHTSIKSFN